MKISIFGMGYVGCVTAACLARDGHSVHGVDIDPAKVDEINAGESPIEEPGLAELMRAQVKAGRLAASTDVKSAIETTDMSFITVGTPSAEDGSIELDALTSVIRSIGTTLRDSLKRHIIVLRSTLFPGMLESEIAETLRTSSGNKLGRTITLCNNPEFLREGTAIRDYDSPPFILIGCDDKTTEKEVLGVYEKVKAERIVTDTRTAALIKYASNSFHALKIAFANEIGSLAQALGADGFRAMEIICKDTKLNISPAYLRPGFAFGGSCLPKDLRALNRFAEKAALRTNVLTSILPSNDFHIQRATKLILGSGHREIAMIGLSFKANTDDLRESPLVTLVETLLGKGIRLKIYDPNVSVKRLRGRNLRFIDQKLPHLAQLLVDNLKDLRKDCSLLVIGNDVADRVDWQGLDFPAVLDLRKDLTRLPAADVAAPGRANAKLSSR